jgi:hypothetical protein
MITATIATVAVNPDSTTRTTNTRASGWVTCLRSSRGHRRPERRRWLVRPMPQQPPLRLPARQLQPGRPQIECGGADSIQRRNRTTSNPRYPAGWTIREGMGLVRSIKLIWLCVGSSGDRPKSPRRGTGRPRRCGSRPVAGSRSKVPLGGVDTFRWRQSRRSPERGPLGTDRAPLVPDPSVTSVPTRSTGGRRQWTQPDNGRELRLWERRMNIVGLARCWSGR